LFWIYVCFVAGRACVNIDASNFPLFSFLIWTGLWVIETVRRWIYTEEETHFKLAHKTRLLCEDYHVCFGPFSVIPTSWCITFPFIFGNVAPWSYDTM
jgi:hypothetical protein